MDNINDTIAAAATPAGRGAIGVIRLSGEGAEDIAARMCPELAGVCDRAVTRVRLADENGPFDDGLACVMREPKSYTGQTVVEIYCHGSPAVVRHALDTLCRAGARPARAGEFTRRALLNGKLDLLQAEAVGDLIDAEAPQSARNALGHLRGVISRQVAEAWRLVTAVIAHVSACVDYPEDDIPEITAAEISAGLTAAAGILKALSDGYERGRYVKDGVNIAIAGPPNAGKSSLFNALLGYDRAIVTDIAGTTRDSIGESLILGGIRVVLHDTAGLRDAENAVEAEGIKRSRDIMEKAQLTLYVIDGTLEQSIPDIGNAVLVVNKADLPQRAELNTGGAVSVSAATGQGLDKLEAAIIERIGIPEPDETLLSNARHAHAVRRALEGVTEAQNALDGGFPADVALGELDIALGALSELTGRTVNEEVLEQIFSKFCVGK